MKIHSLKNRKFDLVLLENLSRFLTIFFLLILLVNFSVYAQSGRRAPKVKSPSSVESQNSEPIPKDEKKDKKQPEISIKFFSNIPLTVYTQINFPERMNDWMIERFNDSSLLEVENAGSVNLNEAQKRAKQSEKQFIVFAELTENPNGFPDAGGTLATKGEVWINFYVFHPQTGKIKQKGTSYLKPEVLRQNRGILDKKITCNRKIYGDEYLLLQASYEVAERIMTGFDVPVPPVNCNKNL